MGTKTIVIPLVLILAFSFPVAFAENGITVSTDKQFYETGEILSISGQIEVKKMPILALRIFDPDGSILSANNVEIEDNSFSKRVSLDSPFYDKPGIYKITIDYGKLNTETTFELISKDTVDVPIIEEPEKIISEVTGLVTDKETYTDNDTIIISGSVSSIDDATVLVGIYDPFGLPTGFYFGDINSKNEFTVSFLAKAGVNFKIDGTYTATAHYGESKSQISFDFIKSIQTETVDKAKEKNQPNTVNKETKTDDTKMIDKEIPEPKQPKVTETKVSKLAPSIIVKEKVSETKEINKNEKQSPKVVEKKPVNADNLSVEDIELGILLNQISLNCDQNEYVDTVSYYDGMGPAMIRLCKYSDAITFFDKELSNDPNNVEILTNKGAALAKLGHFEEAILYYDNALDINPSFVPALNNKANSLSKLGKFEKAIDVYTAAKKLESNNKILDKNLAISKTKFSALEKNHEQTLEPIIQIPKNEKIERIEEIKSETKPLAPDLLEQIGLVFSSIGSIFGIH